MAKSKKIIPKNIKVKNINQKKQEKKQLSDIKLKKCCAVLKSTESIDILWQKHSLKENTVTQNIHLKIKGDCLQINEGNTKFEVTSEKSQLNFNFKLSAKANEVEVVCSNPPYNIKQQQQQQQIVAKRVSPRGHPETQVIKQSKTLSKVMMPTLQSRIDSSWRQCKRLHQNIEINSVIMAKMKSYCAWPARVLEFNTQRKKAKVHFFGSENTGFVDVNEIVEFSKASETIRLLLQREDRFFKSGILSVERILGIPNEFSII